MKIEIDLNDILGDEEGPSETLQESVKRQVIAKLTERVSTGIEKQINDAVAQTISESLKAAVAEQMPALINDLMTASFRPVDQWGNSKEKTTFREQLVASIHAQMTYKKTTYDSDKNAFTLAVDACCKENMVIFRKQFDAQVNEMFAKEAFDYAVKKMSEKLGVKV